MAELKLRKLYRGYVFTDFEGNEIGCKDTEQAMDEVVKLLEPDKKSEESVIEDPVAEGPIAEKRARRTRASTIETHRKIFEKAKDQIELTGKINGAQIARELEVNASNVSIHLKKMHDELDMLIKKWQDERGKPMALAETITNGDGNKSAEK